MLDTLTFESRLQATMDRAYLTAWRILRDRAQAHDACQEAAARALRARTRYDTTRAFAPWFLRIVRNQALDLLKTRGRSTEEMPALIDPEPLPDAVAQAHERERALFLALDRLSDDHREVIELRHFQELTYAEMAEALDCAEGTVMSRLYRARRALRELLREEAT